MILRPVRPASPIGPPMTNVPGGVDQHPVALGGQVEVGEHVVDDVLLDVGLERGVLDVGVVLGREHDGVDAQRAVVLVVLDGDLGLAVGTQVAERAVLADLGEALREPLRDRDRERHQLRGVVAGVAEHQALVTGAALVELVLGGADPRLVAGVDTGGDVGGLGADGDLDAAGVTVEALVGGVVADLEDRLADDVGDGGVGGRAHLAGDHDEAGGQQRLDGHAQVGLVGVRGHQVVEDRVADPVGDLVGVPLGHGLGGEQASSHVALVSLWIGRVRTYLSTSIRDACLSRRIAGRPRPR